MDDTAVSLPIPSAARHAPGEVIPWRILIVTLLGSALSNMDQSLFGYAVPGVMADLGISLSGIGMLISLSFAAAIGSASVIGPITQSLGARRVLAFILAAHRCEASWERYQQTVRDAQATVGESAPEIVYPEPWHDHPLFIKAVASRTREALGRLDASARRDARLIFTAHSIPVAMAEAGRYVEQLTESARMVASDLGVGAWQFAYQSRSGSPRDRWLEPDINDTLRNLASNVAVVVPIGFLCDHVEVLYDLDIEAAQIAREMEIRFERAPTVGNHPLFIEMMASIIRGHVSA